jgi:hypothetical protein
MPLLNTVAHSVHRRLFNKYDIRLRSIEIIDVKNYIMPIF